jgi:peptidoglycan glycosyltransferase
VDRPARWHRQRGSVGRAVLAIASVAIPTIVVLAITIPLLGAHHHTLGSTSPGNGNFKSTLDPAGQRVAAQQLAGRIGTVAVIDPRTGAIKVLYGNPPEGAGGPGPGGAGASTLVRAAGTEYPPGGAFEIVTAAAALDTGRYTPESRIAGPSPLIVSGAPLRNDANQSFGPITLTRALDYSVNTVFAQVGSAVGRQTMARYMARFGFYASPRLDSASDRPAPSGVRRDGSLVEPTSGLVDLGRLAIGQGGLTATPLQMAMVAAAVADDGRLMAPHLETTAPTLQSQVVKPSTAQALARMMGEVVKQGTATAAALAGLGVAGKTGTAHVGAAGSNYTDPWFIGFAPAKDPTIAIAVALSDVKGGFGGTDAAPIAAKVIQALLAHRH